MKLHRSGSSHFLEFIKDFGDDLGCLIIGYGLCENSFPKIITGAIFTSISIYLKFRVFNKD